MSVQKLLDALRTFDGFADDQPSLQLTAAQARAFDTLADRVARRYGAFDAAGLLRIADDVSSSQGLPLYRVTRMGLVEFELATRQIARAESREMQSHPRLTLSA